MKKMAILPLIGLLAGCNTTTFDYVAKDGSQQHIHNSRVAWSSESYDYSMSTNGVWHATATKSGPDAATVQALGAIVGAALAAKP